MTTRQDGACDEVLVAVMATLDGEEAALPAQTIDAHLQGCPRCREEVADMKAVHARLAHVDYPGPRMDLWPAINERMAERAAPREWMALAVIAAICVAWRTGQLLFEWPMPVLNALVPLTALLLIARVFIGDPLAIKLTAPELRQERA